MLTPDRLALLLPQDTLSVPRVIAMLLIADQLAAAFTREPLACASRGGLLGDLSSLKLSYLTPHRNTVFTLYLYSGW